MPATTRLLVVDDEPVICQACQRVLAREGFEVESTTDPRQGLDWAAARDYRAVLLDIKMPGIDGIQFLGRLRAAKPDLPVLIITGYPSVADAAEAVRLGAAEYVVKPFSPEELVRAVQQMLDRAEGGRERENP